MLNSRVLMSDAQNFTVDHAINPYYTCKTVDTQKAVTEHQAIKQMLQNVGVKVASVSSPINCQDGVYTANWALVRGDTAVLANLPNARQAEQVYAAKVLNNLGKKVIHLPSNLKFSGQGDALACGNLLFCGSSYRSDVAAQEIAAEKLGYQRIQLQTIPLLDNSGQTVKNHCSGWADSFFYDLDLALAVIKAPQNGQKGLIAYCPEAFMPASQQMLLSLASVDHITVSLDEAKSALATNLVSTGQSVVMSAHAPLLTAELKKHGLSVYTPEISELAKGGGYIRCVTLTLD